MFLKDSDLSLFFWGMSRYIFSLSRIKSMSQLLQQDSRNYNPVRRPVGQHTTGIPDNPRVYNVVPTQMDLPPAHQGVDPYNGHPKLHHPHMQELKTDPNQPGIDRMIADFGPVESYHESGSYPEVRSKTNVPLTSFFPRAGAPKEISLSPLGSTAQNGKFGASRCSIVK
jgi:hypothetical protein